MKTLKITSIAIAALIAAGTANAQKTFAQVTAEAKAELKAAEQELADLRNQIANEKIPLSNELTTLESKVLEFRKERDEMKSSRDSSDLRLEDLRKKVKLRSDENIYLRNTMAAYVKQFSTRIHAAELQDYKEIADTAEHLAENETATDSEKFTAQLEVLKASLKRVKNIMGGTTIKGDALGKNGLQVSGTFVLAGPFAYFGDGGENIGFAEGDHTNIGYPLVVNRGVPPEVLATIGNLTATGTGAHPVDPTEGDAIKIALVSETLIEHIKKGGVVMFPLLGMFFVAILLSILKFFEIKSVKSPKAGTLQRILDSLNSGNKQQALEAANSVDGPFGDLLVAGVEHADEDKEVLEEVLYERLLAAQPKLERFIAFIALTAAASPLLGLLGTVTGMIDTFKAITVFGTGDPATLSDGISVALITTEYGLIVAIPCLLCQALLTRIAKGKLGEMEQASVAFVNGLNNKK
ncbi:MotA/TolQ/ExbB proton channel family protein [Pelagicoccus mobilis]|uniref:MotA/TolQ/ExbB proton channel family protein n=1 Tax=Pelagicoccus mobilis TaxID=415221 RepID=A0A934RUL8_9BACT|nr:MotA/TolQ/ExbB proton channel family protein [Pelagicoccus mobilis]MBK1877142.1 MotA/TolQ/ExbB proton channel family protein [Pelagicoccus mobilis]